MDLELRDSGDTGQMVVVAAAPVTDLPPPPNVTMLDRQRIWGFCRRGLNSFCKRTLYFSEVRSVIGEAITLWRKFRPGRNDIHVFRWQSLCFGNKIGVETKLQDGACLCLASQLCVDRLIRPVTQLTRRIDAEKHVGASAPASMNERCLNNNRRSAASVAATTPPELSISMRATSSPAFLKCTT